MYVALEAVEAKLRRASKDLKTLEKDAARFLDTDPYRVEVDFDRHTGWHIAYARIIEEPPPDLGVLVGAFAYQLVSGLNLIVWDFAVEQVGVKCATANKRAIQFPFAECETRFKRLPLLDYISEDAAAAIRRVQPYNTPYGDRLFLLRELANADKHRVVASAFALVDFSGLAWQWEPPTVRGPTDKPLPEGGGTHMLENGTPLASIRFEVGNTEAKVRVDPEPAAEIVFDSERGPFRISDLRNYLATYRLVLDILAPH